MLENKGIFLANSPGIFRWTIDNYYPDFIFNLNITKNIDNLMDYKLLNKYRSLGLYKHELFIIDHLKPLEDSNNLYIILYKLYESGNAYIEDDNAFMMFDTCYAGCAIKTLESFYKKFRRLTKAAILSGVDFRFKDNYLRVTSCNEFTLYNGFTYRFADHPTRIYLLHVYDNIDVFIDSYWIEAQTIKFYCEDIRTIITVINKCFNKDRTKVYCKKEFIQELQDRFELGGLSELC
jgi:hypothetical protein